MNGETMDAGADVEAAGADAGVGVEDCGGGGGRVQALVIMDGAVGPGSGFTTGAGCCCCGCCGAETGTCTKPGATGADTGSGASACGSSELLKPVRSWCGFGLGLGYGC